MCVRTFNHLWTVLKMMSDLNETLVELSPGPVTCMQQVIPSRPVCIPITPQFFQRINKMEINVMQTVEKLIWMGKFTLNLSKTKCHLNRSFDINTLSLMFVTLLFKTPLSVFVTHITSRYIYWYIVIKKRVAQCPIVWLEEIECWRRGSSASRLHNSIQQWATSNDDGRRCRGESRYCSRWHSYQWFGATFASPPLSITKSRVTWRPNITRFTQQPSS